MTIAIIGAMDEEVELLKTKLVNRQDDKAGGTYFHYGSIHEEDVVLIKSGIGKVNAAIATTLLLEKFQPDIVINTGSAGGFNPELEVGDLVVSTEVRYNDVDATVFGYEYGQVPQMPARYVSDEQLVEQTKQCAAKENISIADGLILSGDSFMSTDRQVEFLKTTFDNPQCAEMEAGAIAQVCYRFEVPFVVIRALSDIAGKDAKQSYDQFLEKASVNSAALVLSMIHQQKKE
ncbi:5'-methylthioadenosine/S-adenosylhomocysteine nucleosidase [Salibacterium salarium]|uniref:5'-methylthioadenosine/S-adenosylhomocysteine nucleosidase n=1 Tax=Salibacterium salarium TaxID=284579 RepID=A0A3R9PIP2_9BACI|nr:5'-methylthioadenosine/S-adenosylhomocysteine nucleosidase [Salibacterium salarium]RSL31578.1 5'-methylthioadenosine/S-adenosylhomocysteine nucleosidase [Salibacterium salarium]